MTAGEASGAMATKARAAEDQGERETTTTTAGEQEQQAGGQRTATVNLPFMTAQFRAPDHLVPNRNDLNNVARGARSLVPSPSAALFVGGLAVAAVVEAIEWPVAVAIGVGSALASREAAARR
jgi:hypothetical protein